MGVMQDGGDRRIDAAVSGGRRDARIHRYSGGVDFGLTDFSEGRFAEMLNQFTYIARTTPGFHIRDGRAQECWGIRRRSWRGIVAAFDGALDLLSDAICNGLPMSS
jgi:hypothetical protein